MTTLFGHVGEFAEGQEEWRQYVERVRHFFAANDVTDADKKRAVFLSMIGPRTYKLLSSLTTPAAPGEKSFDELAKLLQDHYNPLPSEIVQRFKFHCRFRQSSESVATYVSELRAIAQTCNFAGSILDKMLRDRIVCGINEDRIQQRLLSESKLTLEKALEIAQSMEAATKNAKELQASQVQPVKEQPAQTPEVHKVSPGGQGGGTTTCYRCGKGTHVPAQCPFIKAKCYNCGKIGHIRQACKSEPRQSQRGRGRARQRADVKRVQEPTPSPGDSPEYALHHVSKTRHNKPLEVTVTLDGKSLTMELDTGATVSLVSAVTFRRLWPGRQLEESTTKLCTYSKEPLKVLGVTQVEVKHGSSVASLPLLVIEGNGPNLFGCNWLQQFRLDWNSIHQLKADALQEVLTRYQSVFEPGLGTMKGYQAKIHIEAGAQPRFCRARSVPYAMRAKVEQELDRLVEEGILEPIQHAEWAAPIVPVLKSDQSVRICGDFKVTVNRASRVDKYPIPKIEDLLATLARGKTFSKLDMSQAYQQLSLDPKSRDLVAINTHKGLFRYTRLPFGIASAPGIFQRVMEGLLKGVPGVVTYLDDILVTGETDEEHLAALGEVLRRIESAGLRLKRDKCTFLSPVVTYLGYRIDCEGLHPVPEKVAAIHNAPEPKSVTELKSFLGLLTYYSRFLPNMASTLTPLYALLRKSTPWKWESAEREAFENAKKLLTTDQVLAHYDPSLPLLLACDASAYGIGAVLSHKMGDGSERPVVFASHTLSDTERRYSQIEKEALACVFGVKHFHMYVCGRHFQLQTDHKPLTALFGESKPVSQQASGRIQRWALILASYEYSLAFRSTEEHGNADAMSRLPLPNCPTEVPVPPEMVLLVEGLRDSPISTDQVRVWTRRDPLLSKVLQFTQDGWPQVDVTDELKPYWSRRDELSVEQGCLTWGSRVIVPTQARSQVLTELHAGHPGISRMKAVARMFCWWPGMDREIEQMVRGCNVCQQERPGPPPSPLQPWQWPTRPWSRLHLDFAGPFLGHMFLVLIDAHSKWIEVYQMRSIMSSATIEQLRTTLAQFGLPDTVVTDNGPSFTSVEFDNFLQRNGIKHLQSAPYHPATNGLAERAVQIFKTGMKKMREGTLQERMARVLFTYRTTPHSTTGVTPAELLMSRRLRTRLDHLKPDLNRHVELNQSRQKQSHDAHASDCSVGEGDSVYVRNFTPGAKNKWLPGQIQSKTGPVSCRVELENGRVCRRHQDHVRPRHVMSQQEAELTTESTDTLPSGSDSTSVQRSESLPSSDMTPVTTPDSSPETEPDSNPEEMSKYPRRDRHPPDRYESTL